MIPKLSNLLKLQVKFLIESLLLIIFSILGLIIFFSSGKYIIHPTLYLVTLTMGTGWGLTALHSIITRDKK